MNTGKHVLVIEDHEPMRRILGHFLSKRHQVVSLKDGLEGMTYLSQGNTPDIILLDMSMPRISGLEFLATLRSSGFYRDIPVIVVTSENDQKHIEQCKKLGVKAYIEKPFDPIKLDQLINETFKENISL